MIFGELPLDKAEGAMLAHAVQLGGLRLPKGRTVDAALLAAARGAGLERLWVARLETGDIAEALAATRIAGALAGPEIEVRAPVHGRVNLHSRAAGLLLVAPDAITRANAVGDAVAVSTLPPNTPVAAGDMVATVKIIPYAIAGADLDSACAAARGAAGGVVQVRAWQPGLSACLVQTRLPETAKKLLDKTSEVTRARLARLGIEMTEAPVVPHEVEPLAAALRAAIPGTSDSSLLLVAGATATSDRRDVIPAALLAAGGAVQRVGMPVDPGNLLVLGRLAGATLIGLPGCARSPKRNGLDLVLERLAAGLPVESHDIARLGVGGLLEESGRPVPWNWSANGSRG